MTGNYDLPDLFVISFQEHLLVIHTQGSVFTSGTFNLHFFPSLCGQIRYSFEYLFPPSADGDKINLCLDQLSQVLIIGEPTIKNNISELVIFFVVLLL